LQAIIVFVYIYRKITQAFKWFYASMSAGYGLALQIKKIVFVSIFDIIELL
jgi:hypothetical protein